jgi:hypothetical protein
MTAAEVKHIFAADAARRQAAGMPLKQAELAACLQIVRDVRAGKLEDRPACEFLVEIEMESGRPRKAAKTHARDVLDGKPSQWAPRDFGYPKTTHRPKRVLRRGSEPAGEISMIKSLGFSDGAGGALALGAAESIHSVPRRATGLQNIP